MSSRRFTLRRWLVLALLLGAAPVAARAQSSREYDLKAVLLFNLSRFVEWPATSFAAPGSPLLIGILGDDPFGKVLDEVVRPEIHHGHPLQIVRSSSLAALQNCHILFISASQRDQLPRILPELQGRPILTVADFDPFVGRGGMVGLRRSDGGKIQLRIDLRAARGAGLVVSGKLLQVAEVMNREGN